MVPGQEIIQPAPQVQNLLEGMRFSSLSLAGIAVKMGGR